MTSIRRATAADIPALVPLLVELFAQEAEFTPAPELQRRGLAAIIAEPSVGTILIAEEDGRAVGMANLIYTVSTALGGRVAILEDMIVTKAARAGGRGTAILNAALDAARADGCLRVTLLSDRDNTAAHRFYERIGFRRSAMEPFRLMLTP